MKVAVLVSVLALAAASAPEAPKEANTHVVFGQIPFNPAFYSGNSFVYGQQPISSFTYNKPTALTYSAPFTYHNVAPITYTAPVAPTVYTAGVAPKTFAQTSDEGATHITY